MSDRIDLAALRRNAMAATAGPWSTDSYGAYGVFAPKEFGGWMLASMTTPSGSMRNHEANCRHIAGNDPATVLALLKVVEKAQAVSDAIGAISSAEHKVLNALRDAPEPFKTEALS